MKTIYEAILGKAPWFVRWIFYIFWAGAIAMTWLFWQGWSAKDKSDKYFSAIANDVFTQRIAPLKSARDAEIKGINSTLSEIKTEQKIHGRVLYRLEGKLDQALSQTR